MTEQEAEEMVKALLKRVNEKDHIIAEKDAEIERLKEQSRVEMSGIWLLKNQITDLRKAIMEKDAEIERLLTQAEKDKNTLLASLEAATKEVQRLKAEQSKMFAIYDKLEQEAIGLRARPSNSEFCDMVDKKDAEIERLRAMNYKLAMLVQEVPMLKRHITELCEALNRYGFDGICEPDPQKYDTEAYLLDLIRQAREATR